MWTRRLAAAVAVIALVVVETPPPASADSIRDRAWHLAALGIPDAQKIAQGEGVTVAVIDTGVDDKHAELAGAVLAGRGYGEGNDNDGRVDVVGHGTAMAGLIAGRGLPDNGGVLGIAPKAMILPLLVSNQQSGLGVPQFLADAIDWSAGHGAKVICVAMAVDDDPAVRQAIERALATDVVVVAAAGNRPEQTSIAFPARLPGVVAVGGTDRAGQHAQVSVSGPEMVLAAPSVEIPSTSPSGRYVLGTGTSDATAIVAGVVALVRAEFPRLSGAEVVHRITATAVDKGRPGRDDEFGFGIVDPVAALTADVGGVPSSPAASAVTGVPGGREPGGRGVVWALAGGGVVLLVAVMALVRGRRRARS
ncbi:S8 family serine peptidase [Dactylosporangium sp. CA-139114]|uniref:S8 family serine peptidase n=1 Tax=Dactylosporangium sp. CA-139114 TaxID=3239931 RepID=UPI003D95E0DF